MTADQNISITGQTTDSFTVNSGLGGFITRPNATYFVTASLIDVANIVGVAITSRTTTGFTVQLSASLQASDIIQFHVYDAANTTVPTPVSSVQVLTTSGTYTPTAGTMRVWLRMVGGGGGGGGAPATTGSNAAAGAGGSSGVFFEKWIIPGTSVTGGAFACGSGGAAGSTAGGNGGTGGDTTIVIQGTTYTAKGGGGGVGGVNALDSGVLPTAPAGGTSAGDFSTYQNGGLGIVINGTVWWSGQGGSSPLGQGGLTVGSSTTGNAGSRGGGGGGAANKSGTGRSGGSGGVGTILVYEYA
jgi:hypothetical protein